MILISFIKRNILLYFRDRISVFFSLLRAAAHRGAHAKESPVAGRGQREVPRLV